MELSHFHESWKLVIQFQFCMEFASMKPKSNKLFFKRKKQNSVGRHTLAKKELKAPPAGKKMHHFNIPDLPKKMFYMLFFITL